MTNNRGNTFFIFLKIWRKNNTFYNCERKKIRILAVHFAVELIAVEPLD